MCSSQLHDGCLVRQRAHVKHQCFAVSWLMLVETVSTCKAFCLFAAPWFMHVATVSTCKAYICSQCHAWCLWRQRALARHPIVHSSMCSLRLFMFLLQIQDWCLLRQSALVKHSKFRSYMIDACGEICHSSSMLLLQRAMVKHPGFLYSHSHSYSTRTLTLAIVTCKSSSCFFDSQHL
jgi:hypothetical protein